MWDPHLTNESSLNISISHERNSHTVLISSSDRGHGTTLQQALSLSLMGRMDLFVQHQQILGRLNLKQAQLKGGST